MKYAEFKKKVREYERISATSPEVYRRKVAGLILFGYGFVGFIAILGLLLILLMVLLVLNTGKLNSAEIKLLIVLGIFEFAIISSLFVKIPPPQGIPLSPDSLPELFELIEEIRRSTTAPHIKKVLLDGQFNASVCQIPRLGFFGGTNHYLVLGYPLMATMSPEHFRAVLAHEFGHVSKDHSAFSLWAYRANMTWLTLLNSGASGLARLTMGAFAKWYVPVLNAASYAISRQHEYEADAFAARLTGGRLMAEALSVIEVQALNFSENVVKPLWEGTKKSDKPEEGPYRSLLSRMKNALPDGKADEYLARGLKRKTSVTDSHPSVEDRIKALGQTPYVLPPPQITSAEKFFGNRTAMFGGELDSTWLKDVQLPWQMLHMQAKECEKTIEQLESTGYQKLPFERKMDYAFAVEVVRGDDAALEIFRRISAEYPDQPMASFSVGRMLLRKSDEEGLALMKTSIARDVTLTNPAVEIVSAYLAENGRPDEVDTWYGIEEDSEAKINNAHRNVQSFTASHSYVPHGLEQEMVVKIRDVVAKTKKIRTAWLVRKEIKGHGASVPVYLLAVTVKSFTFTDSDFLQKIEGELHFFPYRIHVRRLELQQFRFRNKLAEVPGSQIFGN